MGIVFDSISSTQLQMLAGVELDRSGVSPSSASQTSVLFGQMRSTGTASATTAVQVSSYERAQGLFGIGSQLSLMVKAYLANDPQGELWCIPMIDKSSGTAASGTIQATAAATASGTIYLWVAGRLLTVGVASGDTVNTIAASINSAINAATELPVTSTVSTDTVTVTCRHKGTIGNEIDMRVNYGTGQVLPAGVALTITQLSSGATDPDTQTTALAALSGVPYRYIVWPYSDDTSLDLVEAEMLDRWDPNEGSLGGAFTGIDDTVANLTTWAGSRNSPHVVGVGLYASPTPIWQTAAAVAGAAARSLKAHPAVPLAGKVVKGVLAPAQASRFTATERNTLGLAGVAGLRFDPSGACQMDSMVTCYLTDSAGAADTRFQYCNALYQTAYLIDDIQATVRATCANKILVDDASVVAPGTPAIDTSMIRARLIGRYAEHVRAAVVEDVDGFADQIVVQRTVGNANRVDVLYPPDLANQLNVLAVLVRPYAQYPEV